MFTNKKKTEFLICNLLKKTIHVHIHWEIHYPKHCCMYSPLEQTEEELGAICIQMEKIWQMLSVKEGN